MRFKVAEEVTFLIGSVLIQQQFNDAGTHRIVIGDRRSEVRGYLGIATLKTPDGTFAGTTEYYGSGLPRVFQMVTGHEVR